MANFYVLYTRVCFSSRAMNVQGDLIEPIEQGSCMVKIGSGSV